VVTETFRIVLAVRPLSLDLSGVVHHVVQGTKVTLECAVLGARPAANVTWYNGSEPIREESLRTEVSLQVIFHCIPNKILFSKICRFVTMVY
jgi:hypothetical protein